MLHYPHIISQAIIWPDSSETNSSNNFSETSDINVTPVQMSRSIPVHFIVHFYRSCQADYRHALSRSIPVHFIVHFYRSCQADYRHALSRSIPVHFIVHFYRSCQADYRHALSRSIPVHFIVHFYRSCQADYRHALSRSIPVHFIVNFYRSCQADYRHALSRSIPVHFIVHFYRSCQADYRHALSDSLISMIFYGPNLAGFSLRIFVRAVEVSLGDVNKPTTRNIRDGNDIVHNKGLARKKRSGSMGICSHVHKNIA